MKLSPDLQARDPLESDLKIRRRRHRDIFFASSYPLLIGLAVFWNHLSSVDGGSAIGGKVANGQYYVANDSGLFNNVGLFRWSLNLIVFVMLFLSALVAMAGMAYFFFAYFYIPFIKAKQNRNKL